MQLIQESELAALQTKNRTLAGDPTENDCPTPRAGFPWQDATWNAGSFVEATFRVPKIFHDVEACPSCRRFMLPGEDRWKSNPDEAPFLSGDAHDHLSFRRHVTSNDHAAFAAAITAPLGLLFPDRAAPRTRGRHVA